MTSELEKIDILRARLDISYKEAKEALDAAGGDVVQALIDLEKRESDFGEYFQDKGQDVLGRVKGFLHKGRDYRIKIKQGDRVVFEVPASLGALGILGALASSEIALVGALGATAAMAKKYTLEFERKPGEGAENCPADEEEDI
ncbi:DUF4342 domain-containing protein [Pelotomaculum propionicicum]|uniref:DUF4342 domain-containing protein n=1 Tax=Pelotomaculum propionicicum TaxID=258475 RepID=UPI003B7807FF